MRRATTMWGLLILGLVDGWGAEPRHQVTLSITMATGAADKLDAAADPAVLTKALADLERAGELTGMTRIRLTTLDATESQFQFGASELIVTGRNFMGGFSRGQTGGAGGPPSVPTYSREETGTILTATAHVMESGVVAELAIEQSQHDRSPPADGDAATPPPPEKSVLTLKSTVAIPKSGSVVVGAFDSTVRGVGQRTIVLASANVSEPIPAVAAQDPEATTVCIFALKKIEPSAAADMLDEMYGDAGLKAVVEMRTNSLIVRGTTEQISAVEALLQRLDQ